MANKLLTKTANDPQGKKEKEVKKYSLLVALFSVLVAMTLWFYVQDAETPDYKKTFSSVSVEMQALSSSFSVIDGGENTVDITLVGKKSDLNKLRASDLEAYADLSGITQSGSFQIDINVLVPEGTELFECFPKTATMFVDQTVSVSVPVKVDLGQYTIGENAVLEADPATDEITVKGPKTILDNVAFATVKAGNLGEITTGFESNLEYVLEDANGTEITSRHIITPERNVKVAFSVYKTKTVPLTVEGLNGWWLKDNMNYTVTPGSIIIKGDPAMIDATESVPAVILDESKLDSTRYTATLAPSQLALPDGVRLGETLGDIKVSLSLRDNGSRTLKMNLNSNHVVVTPPEGEKNYSFADTSLSFKIRGSYNTLYKATLNDFYLNVDLSAIDEVGEVEVPVEIVQTDSSKGSFYAVGTYTVKVNIT